MEFGCVHVMIQLSAHRYRVDARVNNNSPPACSLLSEHPLASYVRRRNDVVAADGRNGGDEPPPQRPRRGVSGGTLCKARRGRKHRKALNSATRTVVECHTLRGITPHGRGPADTAVWGHSILPPSRETEDPQSGRGTPSIREDLHILRIPARGLCTPGRFKLRPLNGEMLSGCQPH